MVLQEQQIAAQIVEIGRRLYERGYIVAGDGNVSARTSDGNVLVTPTGINKGFLKPDMIVKTTLTGQHVAGSHRSSSELAMHLAIYEERPDVQAIVHAHPPIATGFAAAGLALDKAFVSEVVLTLGCIPLAPYGTPSTRELPDALRSLCHRHDAILMANHGAVASGPDLETAFNRMETIEHFARISLTAHVLGGGKPITGPMIGKLIEVREKAGLMSPEMRCQECSYTDEVPGLNCPTSVPTPVSAAEDETVTLTRRELIDLLDRAAQLAAKGNR
ncbi:MAG: class II aldolase/adducin family protein [Blastocatellia bacterium]|nr:class II aldolase/adducin family protein [Blastocatellia bacterium]